MTSLLQLRSSDTENVLEGYAAVFNQDADIGGWFRERIRPGAFTDTLKRNDQVYALFNHDPSQVLGVNFKSDGTAGGVKLHEDRTGLRTTIRPIGTDIGERVSQMVREGVIDKMSFAFVSEDEVWIRENGVDIREITRAKLYDVSPVTYPAYSGTSIGARADLIVSQRAMEARSQFDMTFHDPIPEPKPEPREEPKPDDQPTDGAWEVEIEAERLRMMEVQIP